MNLGLNVSKSCSDVCGTFLLSGCSVTDDLDLVQVVPDLFETSRVVAFESIVFLTNSEYSLRDTVVSKDGRITAGGKLVLCSKILG